MKKSATPQDYTLKELESGQFVHDVSNLKDILMRYEKFLTIKDLDNIIDSSSKLYSRAVTMRQGKRNDQ